MKKTILPFIVIAIVVSACTATNKSAVPSPTQPPVNSAVGASPGTIHNLPVPTPVSKVKEIIAKELGIQINEVVPLEVTEKEWSDGCLGLAQPDEMCTQAIIPGYQIEVQAQNRTFIYRTDIEGSIIRKEK